MLRAALLSVVFALLLLGCDKSEEESTALLELAIADWETGRYQQSLTEFDQVIDQYRDTEAATVAAREKARRFQEYRLAFHPDNSDELNRGKLSRQINNGVKQYMLVHGRYPESLELITDSLERNLVGLLDLCTYEAGLRNAGYKLDCRQADAIASDSLLEAEIPPGIARQRWHDVRNGNLPPPEEGFYAFYINTEEPDRLIFHEQVDNIAINYAWDKFHNIRSQDFGAYWIGEIETGDETKQIAINLSQSHVRVSIDGENIYKGDRSDMVLHRFKPGRHLVEVEFFNNWHTTDFRIAIEDPVTYLSHDEVRQELAANVEGAYTVYFVGLYESSAKDLTVDVHLKETAEPLVLFLTSHSPLSWRVENPAGNIIKAVVYSSSRPGSYVFGDLTPQTLLLAGERKIGTYISQEKCRCTNGHFHCDGSSILPTLELIKELTATEVSGISGGYRAKDLILPETKVTEAFLQEQRDQKLQNKILEKACKKEKDPDFDSVFKESKTNDA